MKKFVCACVCVCAFVSGCGVSWAPITCEKLEGKYTVDYTADYGTCNNTYYPNYVPARVLNFQSVLSCQFGQSVPCCEMIGSQVDGDVEKAQFYCTIDQYTSAIHELTVSLSDQTCGSFVGWDHCTISNAAGNEICSEHYDVYGMR